MIHILNCIEFTDLQKKRLDEVKGVCIHHCRKENITGEMAAEAEIIFGNVPVPMLKFANKLKWLQLNSAGANAYCSKENLPERVILTNAAGAYGPSVSEHMLAQTLTMVKKLHFYQQNQQVCHWKDEGSVLSVEELTVLVIGMGDIGQAYARKMKALGSYVIGIRRNSRKEEEGFDEVHTIDELDAQLQRADVTAIILPGTSETAGLFDENRLHKMKKGSYLINAGRGNIIQTEDLIRVMKEGYLGGAALDVTDPEPLPEEHPLWHTPNVWITPHVAGGFHMKVTLDNIADICKDNLIRYTKGEPLQHQVDRNRQY